MHPAGSEYRGEAMRTERIASALGPANSIPVLSLRIDSA